MQVSNRWQMQ